MVKRISIAVIVLVSGVLAVSSRMGAQTLSLSVLRPANELELQTADRRVTQMARAGQLRLRSSDRDPAFPRRVTERFQQFHQDVPVFGADVVRDAEQGVARSILGTMVPDFELSVTPGLSADEAETALRRLGRRRFEDPSRAGARHSPVGVWSHAGLRRRALDAG